MIYMFSLPDSGDPFISQKCNHIDPPVSFFIIINLSYWPSLGDKRTKH